MVKKADKAPMPESARLIASAVRGLMAERGITQTQMAAMIDRTQSYVSERVSGVDAWNMAELETIARALGFADSFGLLTEVTRRVRPESPASPLTPDEVEDVQATYGTGRRPTSPASPSPPDVSSG